MYPSRGVRISIPETLDRMRPCDRENRIRLMYGGGNKFMDDVWTIVENMSKEQMLKWLANRRMPRPASRRGRRHLGAPTNEDDFVKQLRKLDPADLLQEAVICFRLQEPFVMPRGGWGPGVLQRLLVLYKEVSIMPEPFLQRTGVKRMKIYFRNVYIRTVKSTRLGE